MTNIHSSVVIPVGPYEDRWRQLVGDLALLPKGWEIVLSGDRQPSPIPEYQVPVRQLRTHGSNRGRQLNAGIDAAEGSNLWLVHADSKLSQNTLTRITTTPPGSAINFLDLRFYDGPRQLLRANEIGVKLRCWAWQLPFGDQSYWLTKETFKRVGKFSEQPAEDLLWIMTARKLGIPIRRLPGVISTSGRKYHGQWFKVTADHLRTTMSSQLKSYVDPKW